MRSSHPPVTRQSSHSAAIRGATVLESSTWPCFFCSKRAATTSLCRGASLIEMVVVMSMLTVILLFLGASIHLLLRSEKVVTQSLVTEHTISRLSHHFREDLHRSTTAAYVPAADGVMAHLQLDNGTGKQIRYRVENGLVTREFTENDKTVLRDDFRLPDCQVQILHQHNEKSDSFSLLIERPRAVAQRNPHAPQLLRKLEIEAVLNAQQWLTGSNDKGEKR